MWVIFCFRLKISRCKRSNLLLVFESQGVQTPGPVVRDSLLTEVEE